MLKLMAITNLPQQAQYFERCGVNRIFLDLEKNGKLERQGHLNTLISNHTLQDIKPLKSVLTTAELLVRVNPVYEHSDNEINTAINNGADIIMLPMYHSAAEIAYIADLIDGRAKFIPLLETQAAIDCVDEVLSISGVTEIYIGLNDLAIDLRLTFLFESLTNGVLDNLSQRINNHHVPFGFGGIAKVGHGILPAEKILSEHVRLGSQAVILSRTFFEHLPPLDHSQYQDLLRQEVNKLQHQYSTSQLSSAVDIQRNAAEVEQIIKQIIN